MPLALVLFATPSPLVQEPTKKPTEHSHG